MAIAHGTPGASGGCMEAADPHVGGAMSADDVLLPPGTTRAIGCNNHGCGRTSSTNDKDVLPAGYGRSVPPDGAGGTELGLHDADGDWDGPYTFEAGA